MGCRRFIYVRRLIWLKMSKIVTITLNPSIDKSSSVPSLIPDQKLRCKETKYEPGGGGVNISRAIKKLGGESTAYFLSGGHFGDLFIDLLKLKEIPFQASPIKNETRESLILLDESNANQYLLSMEGPVVEEHEWENFLRLIEDIDSVTLMVASGSLPRGMPVDFFGRLGKIAKKKRARYIVDTSGVALAHAVEAGVYLIKPNLREFGLLVGAANMNIELAKKYATEMLAIQKCEAIIVSLGADGALLVSKEIIEHIPSPPIIQKSTVGAGDSMVAGVVLSLAHRQSLLEATRYGVACGAAAALNPGTALCKKEDADALYLKMGGSKS